MPKKSSSKVSTVTKEESGAGEEKLLATSKKLVKQMHKKRSPKDSNVIKEESDAGQEKPLPSSKKANEIDDIFSSKKRKNTEKEKAEATDETPKKTKKKKSGEVSRESESKPNSKARRRTNDGLVIYSAEELRVNSRDAGGTPLCPFDCSCCF